MSLVYSFMALPRVLSKVGRMRRIGYGCSLHQFSFLRKVYDTPLDDLDSYEKEHYWKIEYWVSLVPYRMNEWLVSVERRATTFRGDVLRFQESEWSAEGAPDEIAISYETDRALYDINVANRSTGFSRIEEFSFILQKPKEMIDSLVKRNFHPVEFKETGFYYA